MVDLRPHPPHYPGMDRRRFLVTALASALAAPLGAEAQQAGKVAQIAILGSTRAEDLPQSEGFRQGLRAVGAGGSGDRVATPINVMEGAS